MEYLVVLVITLVVIAYILSVYNKKQLLSNIINVHCFQMRKGKVAAFPFLCNLFDVH